MSIGERRKPKPDGKPGYVRVDMVHQGDQDGVKGVYHLNMVDEVTQWQVVGAASQISEAWLKPALEAALAQFPFQIKGFHSDNGSESRGRDAPISNRPETRWSCTEIRVIFPHWLRTHLIRFHLLQH